MINTSISHLKQFHRISIGCLFMLSIGCVSWAPPQHSQWGRAGVADPAVELDAPEALTYEAEKPAQRNTLPRTDGAKNDDGISVPLELPAPPDRKADRDDEVADVSRPQTGPKFVPAQPARRPDVELEIGAPEQKQTGTPVTFNLIVRNNGTAATSPLLLVFEVEEPLNCPNCDGRRLGQQIGSLEPGESKELPVSVQSDEIGRFWCQLTLFDGDEEIVQKKRVIEFLPQTILLEIVGPANRTVGSRAEFVIKISNTSKQTFEDFQVLIEHDGVLQQREATVGAETTSQSLSWQRLGSLGAGEVVQLQVEFACPKVTDHADLTVMVTGSGFPSERRETRLQVSAVRGILELQIEDQDDPISVGETTTYAVTVRNRGLQVAQDVALSVELPRGLEFVSASVHEGSQQLTISADRKGQALRFGKVGALRADGNLEYRLVLRGAAVDDVAVKAMLTHGAARSAVEVVEWTTINPGKP